MKKKTGKEQAITKERIKRLGQCAMLLNRHKLSNPNMTSIVEQMLKRPKLMDHEDFPRIIGAVNFIYEEESHFVRFDKDADPMLALSRRSVNA